MVFHFGSSSIHPEVEAVDITPFICIAEVEFSASVLQHLVGKSGLVVFIGIGPEMDPDEMKGIG